MIRRVAGLVILAFIIGPGHLTAGQLPLADEVIEAYVDAIGGRTSHTSPVSIRSTGTIEMARDGYAG